MTQGRYKGKGWWGNSQQHSLAARGIKLYAKKNKVDPMFLARKKEEALPFSHIVDMAKSGLTFDEMQRMHPSADSEDLRKRAIKAIEMREGSKALSTLDSQGVDVSVRMANANPKMKESMLNMINDKQKASFLPEVKAEMLQKRLM